jgi:cystathionine beta-lyase
VAVNPGLDFGTQGAGFARLNLATTPEILAEAVRRMSVAIER